MTGVLHDRPRPQQHDPGHPDPPGAPGGHARRSGSPGSTTRGSRPRRSSSASCARRRRRATISGGRSSSSRSGSGAREKGGMILEQLQRARRLLRLGPDPVHDGPGLFEGGPGRLRRALPRGPHLPRQADGQLVPGLADRALRRGGDHEAGERHALQGALRADGRARGSSSRWRRRGPETIPGDVAIAVHPDDPRYAGPGRAARSGGRSTGPQIPIIADAAVDPKFGSGRPQDHARPRQGGLRGRPAPRAAGPRHPERGRDPERPGGPGARGHGALRGAEEGGRTPRGLGRAGRRGGLPEQRRLLRARGRADRAAPDLAVVAALSRGSRRPRRSSATASSASTRSAGRRSTSTGWRTSRTGASAASSGGATAFPSGTGRASTATA